MADTGVALHRGLSDVPVPNAFRSLGQPTGRLSLLYILCGDADLRRDCLLVSQKTSSKKL